MITRLIPYKTEARPNFWRYQSRHVPEYWDYRFLVEDAWRTHRLIYGLLVEYPVVPQHVLSPADQSIHVPTSHSMQPGIEHPTAGELMEDSLDGQTICQSMSLWNGYQSMHMNGTDLQ